MEFPGAKSKNLFNEKLICSAETTTAWNNFFKGSCNFMQKIFDW